MKTLRWRYLVPPVLLAVAAVTVVSVLDLNSTRDQEYPEALAALDRSEPGWRLPEPEERTTRTAAEELIERIGPELPWGWQPIPNSVPTPGAGYTPPDSLVADARRLATLPAIPVTPNLTGRDWLPGPPPPFVRSALLVARVLHWDGSRYAGRGDHDGAARAAEGIANVRRLLSRDPRLPAIRARLECSDDIFSLAELMLREGLVPERTLARFAAALGEEPPEAVVEFARADRALCHACLEETRAGRLTHGDLPPRLAAERWHGRALRVLTRSVEFTRVRAGDSFATVRAALPGLSDAFQSDGPEADLTTVDGKAWGYLKARHLSALAEVYESVARSAARSRLARVGLAAERYRLRRGEWPRTPQELVPDFLAMWPTDPVGGRPLVWDRTPEGLFIRADEPKPPPPPAGVIGVAPVGLPLPDTLRSDFGVPDPARRTDAFRPRKP
jgi:hypothetical protein